MANSIEKLERTLKEQISELKKNMDNLEVIVSKKDVAEILQIDNISQAGHRTFMLGALFALEGIIEELDDEGGEFNEHR